MAKDEANPGDELAGRERGQTWTIAQLAAELGVTPRALRFYEEQGLVSPRRDGLRRRYSRNDRLRVAWLLRARSVGFSLAEIRELIDAASDSTGSARRRIVLERCRERIARLEARRRDLDAAIDDLRRFAERLERP